MQLLLHEYRVDVVAKLFIFTSFAAPNTMIHVCSNYHQNAFTAHWGDFLELVHSHSVVISGAPMAPNHMFGVHRAIQANIAVFHTLATRASSADVPITHYPSALPCFGLVLSVRAGGQGDIQKGHRLGPQVLASAANAGVSGDACARFTGVLDQTELA